MLSTQYRLRLEAICRSIANNEQVPLQDMIWAQKLAKANTSAREFLTKARRQAEDPDDSMGKFINDMNLGDQHPRNSDDLAEFFNRDDRSDDWVTRD